MIDEGRRTTVAVLVGMSMLAACDGLPTVTETNEVASWEERFADLPAPPARERYEVNVWDTHRAAEIAELDPDLRTVALEGPDRGLVPLIPKVLDPNSLSIEGFREANGYERRDVAWAVELDIVPPSVAMLGIELDQDELEQGSASGGTIPSPDPSLSRWRIGLSAAPSVGSPGTTSRPAG